MSKKKIFPYYNNFPTETRLHIITFFFPTALITYSARLDSTESRIHVLRFHARLDSTKSCIHALIIGSTILFIYLKIILLQCFQFSVSATISSIQTEFYLVPLKFLWPLEFATCIKGVIHPKIIIRLVASNFLYTLAL